MRTSNYMSLHDVISVKASKIRTHDEKEKYVSREIEILTEFKGHKHRFELTMFADNPESLKIKRRKEWE